MDKIGLGLVILSSSWLLYLGGSSLTILFQHDEFTEYRKKEEAERRKRAKAARMRKKQRIARMKKYKNTGGN